MKKENASSQVKQRRSHWNSNFHGRGGVQELGKNTTNAASSLTLSERGLTLRRPS